MSVEVKNISKLYGSQKAVDQASFTVGSGEIVGLLGPNGAGKSTLMKIISCFIPPTEGSVRVCGFDIFDDSLEVRKRVGYLPENNPLYLEMYVREYLKHIAGIYKLKGDIRQKVEEIVQRTGLSPEAHKKIAELSKGYRQRVGLAQALIHDPEILILDEPTSGLDPNQLVDIRKLIKEIGKEKTVILSTHIMQEVEAVCDRVIIINKGRIVADDKTSRLSELSKGKMRIIVEINKDEKPNFLLKIKDVTSVERLDKATFEVLVSGKQDIRGEIFEKVVENKLQVLSMHQENRSLEDVFHELTS